MGARIQTVQRLYGHLPAWRCYSLTKGTFFLCGHCFGLRGDGPATNGEEIWKPGTDIEGNFHHEVVPQSARCEECGARAWPEG